MTHGEKEMQKIITAAFRDSAANGNFICASELFGYDAKDELAERYLIDDESVPTSGPMSVVIYDVDNGEAWEVEVQFKVRDVANQPPYQQMFNAYREQQQVEYE
jgi:hypothetical protein